MNTVDETTTHSVVLSRSALQQRARRWVIKIGSGLLTQDGQRLDLPAMRRFMRQILQLRAEGIEVVLISSGSVSIGKCRLGWAQKMTTAEERQAAASVGQSTLIHAYENLLAKEGFGGRLCVLKSSTRDCTGMPGHIFRSTTVQQWMIHPMRRIKNEVAAPRSEMPHFTAIPMFNIR